MRWRSASPGPVPNSKGCALERSATDLVGQRLDEIPTPSLVVDREAVIGNVAAMADWAAGTVDIRPHVKTHKSVEIARLQLAHGARGLSAATVAEADAMLAAGPDEILLANEIVGPRRIRALTEIARRCRVIVAVDDAANAGELSRATVAAGVEVDVLVDVDVGMHRCGVRTVEQALSVARAAASLPGLRVRGVMGYEGHVVLISDHAERAAAARAAMDMLAQYVQALEHAGFGIEIVSAGGTNTHDMTGTHAVVTELQVGTYAVMDVGYHPFAPRFRPALSVASTVISRSEHTAVLDCGTKTVSVDVTPPSIAAQLGTVREVHEEHMLVDPSSAEALQVGDRVHVAVGYAGGTINLHDAYLVAQGDTVAEVWPVVARGSGMGPGEARGGHAG